MIALSCSAQTTTLLDLTLQNASNVTREHPTTNSATNTTLSTTQPPTTTATVTLTTSTIQPTSVTFTTTTLNSSTSTSSSENTKNSDLFEQIAVYVVSFFLIFGGVVTYIPQYKIISKTCNAHGFSSYVCLTIFVSSILRILFWFGHKFEPALLIQSVVMILGTLVMLELCVRVDRERLPPDERNKKITGKSKLDRIHPSIHPSQNPSGHPSLSLFIFTVDLNPMHFWKWTNFSSYLIFLSIIVVVLSLLTSLLVSYKVYVEIIGQLIRQMSILQGQPNKRFQKRSLLFSRIHLGDC